MNFEGVVVGILMLVLLLPGIVLLLWSLTPREQREKDVEAIRRRRPTDGQTDD